MFDGTHQEQKWGRQKGCDAIIPLPELKGLKCDQAISVGI